MLHLNSWQNAWIILIIIFVGGLIAGKLTEKPRIPDVAAYLLLGILVGPVGLNWVSEPNSSQMNQFLLNLGATLILFDGGRSVQLPIIKKVWVSISLLSTLGVLVSAAIVGVAAHYLLGLSWIISFLLASILAPTDPATLIPVFKRVAIVPRLQQTVESESAFNDATSSVLVFTLIEVLQSGGSINVFDAIGTFLHSSLIGLVTGLVIGLLSLWVISKKGWGIFHEYGSMVMLIAALSSYQVAELMHASGFMAAFTAGVITGNGQIFGWNLATHTEANLHHFGNVITLVMRMMIFFFLGTQVDFHVVNQFLTLGLIIVGILMLIARPLSVMSSVLADRYAKWSWREIGFMFWVRETGIIPAALAGMMEAKHIPHADVVSAIVFLAIMVTIFLQASTTGFVAKSLGVSIAKPEEEI